VTARPSSPPPETATDDLWRVVFEAATDGVTITTLDGRLVEANPAMCAMHGYTPEEFAALPPGAYIDGSDRALRAEVRRRIPEGERFRIRARHLRKDGSGFDVEVLGTPLTYQGELHVLAVVRDIGEQVRAEQLLEERVEQRTRELETLLDVARDTASTLALDDLLSLVMDRLKLVLDYSAVAINVYRGDESMVLARRGPGNVVAGTWMPGRISQGLVRRLASARPLIIDDVRGPSPEAAAYREMTGQLLDTGFAHVVSYMAAPLRGREGAFGTLTVSWHEPGFYTAEHGRLLMAFADHVALAIENARLFDETERHGRELETLLEVARNTASRLDPEPLLQGILDEMSSVIEHSAVAVSLHEGETTSVVARRGPGEGRPPAARAVQPRFEALLHAGVPILIDDVRGPSDLALAYREMVGDLLDVSFSHVQSYMCAPLRGRSGVFGSLGVSWHEPGRYTERHSRLLMAFADHAALAIENSRLFDAARRRTRELEALHTADEALHRSLRLNDVLQAMVDLAVDLLEADASALYTWDPETGRGDVPATSGFRAEDRRLVIDRFRRDPGRPPEDFSVTVYDDPASEASLDQAVVAATGVKSMVELPIVAGGELFGVFAIGFRSPRSFSESDRRMFETLANRAGLAIENARLYERAQQTASLEERQRLARELHDSVSQALYGIALGARTARMWLDRDTARVAEPLEYALSLAEVGLAEMRALIFELRPESLESEGLVAALERQAAAISARYEIAIERRLCAEPALGAASREALYRIAQEAMHNVVKHAGAGKIELTLDAGGRSATLSVRDNGAGFDASADFPGHLGLRSMRERAERAGGALTVTSAPALGTAITVTVPL
jgi:PAS domain S-box-containing protein